MKWLLILVILFGAIDAARPAEESLGTKTNTKSQTSEEEIDTYSSAREFAETKESFSESIADRDVEEQIEAQENISYSNTERVTICDRNSVAQSGGNTGTCTREERLAERDTFA
ncbi:MAG: hypothetical protein DME80_03570 [Verrucomicrobia bacterium]|nr:MAG: hypothetical protein DME80_03570 [Verrucomicrobiota bacterium]